MQGLYCKTMIYAVSDLHGCFEKYKALLDHLNLSDIDTLYILGDIVDRGEGGIRIILDLLSRKNVVCLRGNHDHAAVLCLSHLADARDGIESDRLMEAFRLWLSDGGAPTLSSFLELDETEQQSVCDFLSALPYYKEISVQGKQFFLAHTVPEKEKMIHSSPCLHDFLTGEPEYEKAYYGDVILVTGHIPTGFIDPDCTGRIWKGNNHIAIDCGAVFGNPLGCICLDTMEEIYVEEP